MYVNISKDGLEPCWRELDSNNLYIIKCENVNCNHNDHCKECIFYDSQFRKEEWYYTNKLNEMNRLQDCEIDNKDITLRYLEKLLDKMNSLEDLNYMTNCWNSSLRKEIETLEEAIELIEKWSE